MVSGGGGASGIFDRAVFVSPSFLTAGAPKIEELEVGFGAPKMLDIPPEGAIFDPKRLDPPAGAAVLKPNFWGAGVLVGVVDSCLKIDLGFCSSGGGVVVSISSS